MKKLLYLMVVLASQTYAGNRFSAEPSAPTILNAARIANNASNYSTQAESYFGINVLACEIKRNGQVVKTVYYMQKEGTNKFELLGSQASAMLICAERAKKEQAAK